MRPRIFDHLDGGPEDALFSRVAWRMRRDPRWTQVPTWTDPLPVSGEIEAR